MSGWMDVWTDGRMDGWMDARRDRRTDGRIEVGVYMYVPLGSKYKKQYLLRGLESVRWYLLWSPKG